VYKEFKVKDAVRDLSIDFIAMDFLFLDNRKIDSDNVNTELWALWKVLPTTSLGAQTIIVLSFLDHGKQRIQTIIP
jgi:hypothetical protein